MFLSQQIQLLCVLDLFRGRERWGERGRENVRERNLLKSAWKRKKERKKEFEKLNPN
jgi:hypothetical protein